MHSCFDLLGITVNSERTERSNSQLQSYIYICICIYQEQVTWAVEEGVDYMIGETFNDYGEAKLALEAIQKYGKGIYIQ